MIKKSTLLAMAIGALATLAAPAAAQADELYTSVGGIKSPLKIGAKLTLTSTNLELKSVTGGLQCTKVTVHGEITANGPTVAIKEESTTVEGCNHGVTDPTFGAITLGGGAGTTTGTKLVIEGICTYSGNVPFSYATNSDTITVTGSNQLTGSPAFLCGQATTVGTFTFETNTGTPVFIS